MSPRRIAEVKVLHLVILIIVVGSLGSVALAFFGVISIGPLNESNLKFWSTKAVQTASGYTPAKTPTEAMDKFMKAIHARDYKAAKIYTTKSYGDMLERTHTAAYDLGTVIDKIRNFGKNQSILNDKTTYVLFQLDPFPTNFGADKPPEEKGGKAYGKYKWEPLAIKSTLPQLAAQMVSDFDSLDKDMFQTVLAPPRLFAGQIELVKEGEEWKLNIPTNPQWETAAAHFLNNAKTYHTGLVALESDLRRNVYDNPNAYERDLFAKLRLAKK